MKFLRCCIKRRLHEAPTAASDAHCSQPLANSCVSSDNSKQSPSTAEQPSMKPPSNSRDDVASPADDVQLESRANAAAALFSKLAAADPGNAVVAVHPLVDVLSVAYAGAAGDTAAEMRAALRFADGPEAHPRLSAAPQITVSDDSACYAHATRLWPQHGLPFVQSFLQKLSSATAPGRERCFQDVDYERAPEAARQMINAWVSAQTKEHVTKLLPENALSPNTRLVITAACYFKAQWVHPLNAGSTLQFSAASGAAQTVQALRFRDSKVHFACVSNADFDAVRLPYQGINAAMLLVKPHGKLEDFEERLTGGMLSTLMHEAANSPLDLTMPRFKISQSHSLSEALQQLGARRMFDVDQADFSGLTQPRSPAERLCVSAVQHEAFVEVDEKGTVAGGAAAVVMTVRGLPPPVQYFKLTLDSPFLYVIQNVATGEPLIVGHVKDAAAAQ